MLQLRRKLQKYYLIYLLHISEEKRKGDTMLETPTVGSVFQPDKRIWENKIKIHIVTVQKYI